MIFRELTEQEFKDYALTHPQRNFFESLYMKQLLQLEKREVYLVGVVEENKILAATLLASSTQFLGQKTYEALKGFLIDYHNKPLLNFFVSEVKKFVKQKNGFRLIIDP